MLIYHISHSLILPVLYYICMYVYIYDINLQIFYIMVVLMFGNLLIAMINSTYGILVEYNDELLLIEKYNIMVRVRMCIYMCIRV